MGIQGSTLGQAGMLSMVMPKCPAPFVSADALSCVMPCPADKKFVRQSVGTGFKCVYSPDQQFSVSLVTVGATVFNGTSVEDLRQTDPQKYLEFSTETDRFNREIAVVDGNISKQAKIFNAFRDLQAAENVRDVSPDAYQVARTAYYTLVNGQSWINEERERIAKTEVTPEVKKYQDSVAQIQYQQRQQQMTMDVVRGVKDKVISLKDDFKYSVDTLSDQVEKLKIQINMENRSREKEVEPFWNWLDTILNIVLVAALLYVAYVAYKKYTAAPPAPPTYILPS